MHTIGNNFLGMLLFTIFALQPGSSGAAQEAAAIAGKADDSCAVECYLGCYARDLNLTDSQRSQMQQLVDRFRENTGTLRERLKESQDREKESSGAFDESAARAAAQSRANLRAEMEVAHSRLKSELYALLTTEQREKLAEQRRACEERRRNCRSSSREDGTKSMALKRDVKDQR